MNRSVVGYLKLSQGGMPQDIRSSPDGSTFYVAEMMRGGVYTIDPNSFTETGFIPTGIGTHGLYPSRDGTKLYIANRGSDHVGGPPGGPGSVSVLDFATKAVDGHVADPGWRQPRHGQRQRRRQDALAQRSLRRRRVRDRHRRRGASPRSRSGKEPHGLTVWPQPGRYSLGHTGNMR